MSYIATVATLNTAPPNTIFKWFVETGHSSGLEHTEGGPTDRFLFKHPSDGSTEGGEGRVDYEDSRGELVRRICDAIRNTNRINKFINVISQKGTAATDEEGCVCEDEFLWTPRCGLIHDDPENVSVSIP